MSKIIKITAGDNVAVALEPLHAGESYLGVTLREDVPAGHKFALTDIAEGENIVKYAFPIGHATQPIPAGSWVHTHNVKGYLGRLLLFGLISEVPFDLAFFRTPFAPQHQNVYWTLALGVLAMAGLKRFEKENGLPGWQGLVWAGGCAALALAANTDYHAIGVLIICTLYLTRADRKRQCLAGAVLFLFELTAPLAFVLVWFYNGQRGACSPLLKKAFYWFYPVHLLVLAMITNLML